MAQEKVYIGTDVKFIVEPTSPGFDKTQDDFEVLLKRGKITKKFTKSDMIVDEDDNYYICFSTTEFGKGLVQAIITAHVPDDDFEDGFREEVDKIDLIDIMAV